MCLLECLRYMFFCICSSAHRCTDGQTDSQLDGQAQTYTWMDKQTDGLASAEKVFSGVLSLRDVQRLHKRSQLYVTINNDISTRYCCSYSQYNRTYIAFKAVSMRLSVYLNKKTYAVGTRKNRLM